MLCLPDLNYSLSKVVRGLLGDVGEKSHETRALYCCFNSALLFGRERGALAAHDATVRVDELPQKVYVFVVHVAYVVLSQDIHGFVY